MIQTVSKLGKPKYNRTELYSPEEILAIVDKAGLMKLWMIQTLVALSAIFGKRIIENLRLRRRDIEISRSIVKVRFQVAKKKRKTWDEVYGQIHYKTITLKHPLAPIIVRYVRNFDRVFANWDLEPINNNWHCLSCGKVTLFGKQQVAIFTPNYNATIREVNEYIKNEHPKCKICGHLFELIKFNPWLFPDEKKQDKLYTVKGHIIRTQINPDGSSIERRLEKIYSYKREGGHITPDSALYYLKKIQPDAYYHLFRATLATAYANRGATEYKLMAHFDWDDPKVAANYVKRAGVTTKEMSSRKWIT
jgi:hypothetical protein